VPRVFQLLHKDFASLPRRKRKVAAKMQLRRIRHRQQGAQLLLHRRSGQVEVQELQRRPQARDLGPVGEICQHPGEHVDSACHNRQRRAGVRNDDPQVGMPDEHTREHEIRDRAGGPQVRVRLRGQWRSGTAQLLRDDDAHARLRSLPSMNSAVAHAFGADPLTLRIDLDD
jgi:hypothetical protein